MQQEEANKEVLYGSVLNHITTCKKDVVPEGQLLL